ncbi:hypothetical protein AB3S75_011678 [Citrus x aurantiifolia]
MTTISPGMGQPNGDPRRIPRPEPSSSSATSDFIVMDKGNCSPRYMRCTIGQQYDNPLSKKFNDVVNEMRRERCSTSARGRVRKEIFQVSANFDILICCSAVTG